jgi:hypothetical protein
MGVPPIIDIPDWYNTSFDTYCLEVGRLTGLWAVLERSIDELIWELMDIPAFFGACVTAQMIGPGPGIRALLSLVEVHQADAELSGKFQQFGKRVSTLGAKRNRYAHDTIGIGTITGHHLKTEITADHRLRIKAAEIDLNKIRTLWMEIREERMKLALLRTLLIDQLPSWTRTRYERSRAIKPPDTPGPS